MVKAVFSNSDVAANELPDAARTATAPVDDAAMDSLLARLRGNGAECTLFGVGPRLTAGGVSVKVPVADTLGLPLLMTRLANSLLPLLQDGVPVTLNLSKLRRRKQSAEMLREFCESLVCALGVDGVSYAMPGLSVPAAEVALGGLLEATTTFGGGARYVVVDEQMIRDSAGRLEGIWDVLYSSCNAAPVAWPVYGREVRALCDLLGDESATVVLPDQALCVPTGSAWLPIRLDLMQFARDGGDLDWPRLSGALQIVLETADQLFDQLSWPFAAQRNDAWLNRRLAIQLTGLGKLVQFRGQRPSDLAALRALDRDIARIAELLYRETRRLALERGALPALTANDPSGAWRDSQQRDTWRRRWRQAVQNAAVRHRNILVISPYTLLATPKSNYRECADLLPVLRHAQAVAFADPPQCAGGADDFCTFHRRAAAVLHANRHR